MSSLAGLSVVLLLVAANAFFVATEFALVSSRSTRIDQIAAQGSRAARMVQRYNALDTVLRRQPRWLKGIQAELDSLIAKANRGKMAEILEAYLPTFDLPFIDLCLASLRPRYSRWRWDWFLQA